MTESPAVDTKVTSLNDAIIQSPLLPWREKLLYYSIKSLLKEGGGGKRGEFSASKEALAAMIGLSVRTIQRMLRKWRDAGYLVVKEPNRFKPVKYEFLEDLLLLKAVEFGKMTEGPTSTENVEKMNGLLGRPVAEVGRMDKLVGQPVAEVGQDRHFGRTVGRLDGPQKEPGHAEDKQDWRTPERDEIVKEMGQKMNEMSTDLMDHFVIDEKWLQFLTREEYNHLIKISRDLSKNRP